MGFNGSGTFIRSNGQFTGPTIWQQDRDASINILATRHDVEGQDYADGLTNCVTRDGQSTIVANIPFNGYKPTNVGAGTSRTDISRVDQVQDGSYLYLGVVAGTNTYTANLIPTISAYAAGMTVRGFFTNGATTSSTLNINGVGAASILTPNGNAAGQYHILGGRIQELTYDGTAWRLKADSNPAYVREGYWGGTSTGAANNYNITLPGVTGYTSGLRVSFKAHQANTASPAINVNGLGTKAWVTNNEKTLKIAQVFNNGVYSAIYDATYGGVGGFITTGFNANVTGTQAWTPTVDNNGSSLTFTGSPNIAQYSIHGSNFIGVIRGTLTLTGGAGNTLRVSLPSGYNFAFIDSNLILGSGRLTDTSVGQSVGFVRYNGASDAHFDISRADGQNFTINTLSFGITFVGFLN